jgi:hypothetical protein
LRDFCEDDDGVEKADAGLEELRRDAALALSHALCRREDERDPGELVFAMYCFRSAVSVSSDSACKVSIQ